MASSEQQHDFARAPDQQQQQQTASCTTTNNNIFSTREGAVVDPYDDATLGRLAPEAYGRDGCFDPITAHLLVRGHFVPAPAAAAALAVRVQAELEVYDAATDRRHHGGRPARRKALTKNNSNNNNRPSSSLPTPTRARQPAATTDKRRNDPGDRVPWDNEMTRVVVELHAKRVSFKRISEHIAGKGVKACQEHYYRVIKAPAWKKLHKEIRQKHALG